ncbi:XdhC family protein [Bacillus sp. Marseille-P3661]|uniref:XdhC family protein n=1 Tax=Bacillus sp. Marseille-P3661 TaxID=1936234 RepID=UPI002155C1C3|nr:XdhC family protein [Bacillus sp. Marseille-P3661]
MMSSKMLQLLNNGLNEQKSSALVTITSHPQQDFLGKKFLVWEDGTTYHEYIETENVSVSLIDLCQSFIQKEKTKCIRFQLNGIEIEAFVEVFQPEPHLIIAGAGHVCEPVVQFASLLNYRITVIDDRKELARKERFPFANEVICCSFMDYFRDCQITANTWILLLTRGHQFDVISLQELLKREDSPAYIGMIGSRRRIAGVLEQLREDFSEKALDHIFTPVGLDIGAETPSEIAISILAEMLMVKNKKAGQSLSQEIRGLAKLGFRGGKNG